MKPDMDGGLNMDVGVLSPDEAKALETLKILNPIISLSAERLDGLRTQCATNAEITHQEIRTLEGKLVKMFSDQLVAKKMISTQNLPPEFQTRSLRLWLQVVGLTSKLTQGICNRAASLESLKERSDHEIRNLMAEHHANDEETRRLTRALQNLKRYTDLRSRNQKENQVSSVPAVNNDLNDLYWDSWDMQKVHNESIPSSASPHIGLRAARSSVSSEEYLRDGNCRQGTSGQNSCSTTPCTPVTTIAPSSLNSPAFSPGSHPNTCSPTNSSVFSPSSTSPASCGEHGPTPPSTPPVKGKKHSVPLSQIGASNSNLQPESFSLTKSKSHESQLANRIESVSENNLVSPHLYTAKPNVSRSVKDMNLMNAFSTPWLNLSIGITMGYSLDQLPAGKRRERLPTEPGPGVATSTWDPSSATPSTSNACSVSASVSSVNNSMGGYASPSSASPIKSPPLHHHIDIGDELDPHKNSLQVPKSPRTPTLARSMGHMISHRFAKMIKVTTCDYCFKQVIIGLRCKECKFKCHRDCEPKVPPSCGLPTEFIDVFAQYLKQDVDRPMPSFTASPSHWGKRDRKKTRPPGNMIQPFPGQDSSSNTSSCNSSTPSSPFFAPNSGPASSYSNNSNHFFPTDVDRGVSLDSGPLIDRTLSERTIDLTSTEKSNDSDRTISQTSGSGSTDSEKTLALRVDSQDSQVSDGEPGERSWPRQNSLSNREWDIPFDELKLGDKIGTGHFGTVYRGNWHGDVAIKLLDMYLDNEKTLEQFRQEVATFRKTRHENLVLFMGACMKPPRLAIVTSMCKGMSLYTHVHLRKDKFNMNRIAAIAAQITQGMGYLHARGIIHKDLKSKNIFIESGNGKVVITDFGLFSVTKLCQGLREGDSLSIPPGWLCYLAPEIMKALRPVSKQDIEFPFTTASDIYAFGTVWYELLTSDWPYQGLPAEAIIWQVGSGIRQPLPTLFSRDVKEILMSCWAARPEDRLDFAKIQKIVERLPKKRLARSPSHPIHLSRSAESVF
ncbi:kinase suppressor of Ras 2 isoform X1 [Folsomia candida]|uniref:kinase suppressor of Ras 2 isoform X1 n=1 Tax=Folsomia candida TaxID=158441 RepID=UPI001604C20E|nr:kinase suppressor of Ras 2 isoform X1 [Folsomia candida]XP_035708631.1 kinase suppressor of Ras 2 isoform X1 [Folsomia candida]XP_035708632.1 kinase suppressor of Ras 2 isoform X1 [Folsomia candida]XP_035708633.1 kinase suppressor of Ras 2 isoform X1 [Folsomia candida]